jgi:hypothetical protein
MKVKFEREKETRNTIKYHEVAEQGKPPIIGTLYVQHGWGQAYFLGMTSREESQGQVLKCELWCHP